jgi:hypothetical protein
MSPFMWAKEAQMLEQWEPMVAVVRKQPLYTMENPCLPHREAVVQAGQQAQVVEVVQVVPVITVAMPRAVRQELQPVAPRLQLHFGNLSLVPMPVPLERQSQVYPGCGIMLVVLLIYIIFN